MANLVVTPSYQLTETDILTVDKINLMATPVVNLSIETPVSDINYLRNGNFYSAFWQTPGGIVCQPGVWTGNASYWLVFVGAATATLTYQRSNNTPDLFSLFSAQLVGSPPGLGSVVNAYFGQQINGDLSATLRRVCTFSGYIQNNSGQVLNPQLTFYTCNQFNNFNSITQQATIDLPSCPINAWTFVSASQDVSQLANAANGLFVIIVIPGTNLAANTQTLNFSRLKFQIGELATEFSDDPSLFVQTPSIDSTMLQDGCIARPSLFLPGVIPQGAFAAGAIRSADIAAGGVAGSNLAAGATVANLGYTPVNKAGDNGIGMLQSVWDTPVNLNAYLNSGLMVQTTSGNANNNNFDPAIGFSRPGVYGRTIGLAPSGRFRTVNEVGIIGYLLDTISGVDSGSYQTGSITLPALAQSLINILVPPGMIRMFGGPNIPPNWLVCDGSAVSRTTYAALFAAIGTYWGAGDSINTFNLPDLRGRSPLGYVSTPVGGITSRAFASRGGEENHVLSVAELANHGHPLTDGTHAHALAQTPHLHTYVNPLGSSVVVQGGSQAIYQPGGTFNTSAQNANITCDPASANIAIANTGSNGAHNNMQPFAVMYFIIKT